jgi:hypothetical protein
VASGFFLFYGLIVVGLFLVILAFVHLSQSKQNKSNNGEVPVIKFYPTDKPQEKARFMKALTLRRPWRFRTGNHHLFPIVTSRSRCFSTEWKSAGVAPDAPLCLYSDEEK